MWYDQEITARLNATLLSYDSFKQRGHRYVSEVIPRGGILRDDFVPWAPGIVTPSRQLLREVNSVLGSRPLRGWHETEPGSFVKKQPYSQLYVTRCGDFWAIERMSCESLVLEFGSQPIFARKKEDAMRLAEVCEWHVSSLPGLRWVQSEPAGVKWV
jgi:hypothetical protein